MNRLRRAVPRLVLALAILAPACATTTPAPKAPPKIACTAVKGQPSFCPSGSEHFIVGLYAAQGGDRTDRWLLEVPLEDVEPRQMKTVAMVVVVEPYPDAAKVHVLYQTQANLDGAIARRVGKDERARLEKYVGRVADVKGGRVQLDLGQQDKVQKGDVYQILSPRDHTTPIARIQVTELADLVAWGVPLDQGEPLGTGMDAVYLRGAEGSDVSPVSILVVNFDPADEQDTDTAKAGRSLAKELGEALGNAAGAGLKVRYEVNERVRGGTSEEQGHKEARRIGQKYGADIVVWGSVRCDKAACMQPRFTVVNEQHLKERGYKGADLRGEKDDAGWVLKGQAPEDPVALAAAILGSVAYTAQRYGDATYYLERALAKNVLHATDEFQGRKRLAYAMYVRGQTAGAREQAGKLIGRAREAHDEGWEQRGHGELVRVYALEGKVSEERAELETMRKWAEAHGDSSSLSYVLHTLGTLEAQQGRVDEARKLYNQSRDIDRRTGDFGGEAATLHALAILEEQQGRVDEARKLYNQSLDIERRIGNVEGEAPTLHQLAILEEQQGRVDEARKLYNQSLDIERRIGNVNGEASTLHALAILEEQQGRVDEARKLYNQSLDIKRRIGNVKGEAATLAQLAGLEAQRGRVDEARKLYNQSLDIERRIGNVKGEAATLAQLAGLEAQRGRVDEARKLYNQSLDIERRIGDIKNEAASLHQLAMLEHAQGHLEEARRLFQRSLDLERRLGHVEGEIVSAVNLAVMDFESSKPDAARSILEASLEKARQTRLVESQANIQSLLAQIDVAQGNSVSARQRWTEALALFRQLKIAADITEVAAHLIALTALESVAAAWRGHASLLAFGGVLISGIQPGGQAEAAALQPGDILIRYNQTHLDKPDTLTPLAKAADPAKPVTLEVLRGAQKLTVKVHGGLLGISIADLPPNPAAPKP